MSRRDPLFDKLVLLDRLEEIREDLTELGIGSLDELTARIEQLEAEVGDSDADDSLEADGPV